MSEFINKKAVEEAAEGFWNKQKVGIISGAVAAFTVGLLLAWVLL